MSAYRLYLIIGAVWSFAASLAFTLNQVYAVKTVHLSPFQLVLVGTVMEAVCFVAQVPTGILADLYSRRLAVIVGYLLMGGGMLLWGLVPAFWAILVANAVWAVGCVFTMGAEEAWAADELGEENVAKAFVRGGQVGQVATFLGIPVAVALAVIGLNIPMVVAAVVTLVLGAVLAVVMKEHNFTPAARSELTTFHSMKAQAVDGVRAIRGNRVLTYVMLGSFFIGLASEGFDRLSVAHFIRDLRMPAELSSEVWIGIFTAIAALGSVALTGWLGGRADVMRPRRVGTLMTVVQLVTSAGMIWFGLAGSFWYAVIAYLVVTLMRESQSPVRSVWLVSNTESRSRATVLSFDAQLDALGQVAGGPPIGYLGSATTTGTAIAASGLLLLPAVAAFALATKVTRPSAPSAEVITELGAVPA